MESTLEWTGTREIDRSIDRKPKAAGGRRWDTLDCLLPGLSRFLGSEKPTRAPVVGDESPCPGASDYRDVSENGLPEVKGRAPLSAGPPPT